MICTGSELVSSKTNRYVPLFSARLHPLGFRIFREHSVGDDLKAIAKTVLCGLNNADLVITCGGLGPTFDDLTRQGAAKALGKKLFYSKHAEQILKDVYNLKELPPNFKNQCLMIAGARPLRNANGTAFGQIITVGKKMLLLLPGPQSEWIPMFDDLAAGAIRDFFRVRAGQIKTLRLKISDIWEVEAEKLLQPVMRRFTDTDYTVLAGPNIAEFAFTVSGKNQGEAAAKLAAVEKACRKKLGDRIYGTGEDTLEGTVGALLTQKKATISLAESCTGGAVADALTDIPGSSAYFCGGVTAYSNKSKETVLGVRRNTLLKYGAVSAECAAEMAECARRLFKTDYSAAVTGIAGPGGETKEKPVGLVCFAVAGSAINTRTFTRSFRHTRAHIKRCSVNFILDSLRKIIQ